MATILGKLLKIKQKMVLPAGIKRSLVLPVLPAEIKRSLVLPTGRGFATAPAEYMYVPDKSGVGRLNVRWSGPPLHTIKGNCDFSGKPAGAGVSYFFRNSDIDYVDGDYEEVPIEATPTTGEAYAILQSLEKADKLSMGKLQVWIETDCKSLVDYLDKVCSIDPAYRALMNRIAKKIKYLKKKCGGCHVTFIHREANGPANIAARLSQKGKLSFPSVKDFPESIASKMLAALKLNKEGVWFEVVER